MHATVCSGRWYVHIMDYDLSIPRGLGESNFTCQERMLSIQLRFPLYQEAIRPRFKSGMSAD